MVGDVEDGERDGVVDNEGEIERLEQDNYSQN